jgi:excisionase family DNA binding protein
MSRFVRGAAFTCMTAISRPTNEPARDPHRPLLVDVSEAAAILAISRSSIYQLIWSEQLMPVRIGRSVRFSLEQLEQFVTDRIAAS